MPRRSLHIPPFHLNHIHVFMHMSIALIFVDLVSNCRKKEQFCKLFRSAWPPSERWRCVLSKRCFLRATKREGKTKSNADRNDRKKITKYVETSECCVVAAAAAPAAFAIAKCLHYTIFVRCCGKSSAVRTCVCVCAWVQFAVLLHFIFQVSLK